MRQLWDIIATIFRISWRALNFIREFVFNAIFLVLFFVVIGSIALYQTETQPEKLFLVLCMWIYRVIVDQVSTDPFGRMSRELLVPQTAECKKIHYSTSLIPSVPLQMMIALQGWYYA